MAVIHADKAAMAGIMDDLSRDTKILVWKTAIKSITGEDPIVKNYTTYSDIEFTPAQVKLLRGKMDDWSAADPGEVRIGFQPVVVPWAVKKYWPVALGAVGLGWVIGKLI